MEPEADVRPLPLRVRGQRAPASKFMDAWLCRDASEHFRVIVKQHSLTNRTLPDRTGDATPSDGPVGELSPTDGVDGPNGISVPQSGRKNL